MPCPCGSGMKYKKCCGLKAANSLVKPSGDLLDIPWAMQRAWDDCQSGNLDNAGRLYRKILKLQPNYADAIYHLGIVLSKQGNHKDAIKVVRKAIKRKPGNADYYSTLGHILVETGNPLEAIASLNQAYSLEA